MTHRPRDGPAAGRGPGRRAARPRRADGHRRAARPAARAAAVDAAARLRERAALPGRVRRRRRAPRRLPRARRPGEVPDHQPRPTCATTTRSACSPSRRTRSAASTPRRGTTGRPTVVGYTERDIDTWATVMARSIRAAGGRPGDRLHNAYGYGLFTGGLGAHYGAEKLGCTVIPISGGMTPRQVQLIQDFEPRVIMVTPSYMLTVIDEFEKQGVDPRSTSLRDRHLRRRAVDRADAPGDGGAPRHRGGRHLRPVRGHGPRRRPGVRGDQGRPARLGGPLLPGDHRPDHRRGAARGREGRAGLHLADQGGHAGHPLPHPRPDPAAARHRPAGHAAHGEGHRPHRRHDHPARGERLPDADRGGRAADRRACRRTSRWC